MYAYRFLGDMHTICRRSCLRRDRKSIVHLCSPTNKRHLDADNVTWQQSAAESHVLAATLARLGWRYPGVAERTSIQPEGLSTRS